MGKDELAMAIRGLAKDTLQDEHGVRNIVTAIYALSESITLLSEAIKLHIYRDGAEIVMSRELPL